MAMASTRSALPTWFSGYEIALREEEDDDPSDFSNHLPLLEFVYQIPLDFTNKMSANCVYPPWSTLDDAQSNHPTPNLILDEIGDFLVLAYCGYGSGPLEEMSPIVSRIKRTPEYNLLRLEAGSKAERSAAAKRPRDGSGSNATNSDLSKKAISQYFYVPIMQAAKELNVGVTLLKKRCRELGIRWWPHRKLTSLRTPMKNVDMGGGASERCAGKPREVIQIMEQERRLLKEAADVQQGMLQANYKKRKLLGASQNGAYSDASSSNPSSYAGHRLGWLDKIRRMVFESF